MDQDLVYISEQQVCVTCTTVVIGKLRQRVILMTPMNCKNSLPNSGYLKQDLGIVSSEMSPHILPSQISLTWSYGAILWAHQLHQMKCEGQWQCQSDSIHTVWWTLYITASNSIIIVTKRSALFTDALLCHLLCSLWEHVRTLGLNSSQFRNEYSF